MEYKKQTLDDYKIAQRYLDVCFQFDNCGKCLRILVSLDMLNVLDNFRDCFDIEYFKQNKSDAYFWLLRKSDKHSLEDNAIFANDLLERAKKIIPFKSLFIVLFF